MANYLESKYIRKKGGGDDIREQEIDNYKINKKEEEIGFKYERQIETCGRNFIHPKIKRILTLHCMKPLCPKCGGKNGRIHKRRYRSIAERLKGQHYRLMRQFVFTVPMHLRYHFRNKKMLNALFGLAERIIKKEFGIKVRGKKERYALHKLTVAIMHLFGDDTLNFNPHVNVLLFENKTRDGFLQPEQMERIKKRFRNALKGLLPSKKVEVVDINYKYYADMSAVNAAIWYMATPFRHDLLDAVSNDVAALIYSDFISIKLHGFRPIRHWGSVAVKQLPKSQGELKTFSKSKRRKSAHNQPRRGKTKDQKKYDA